MTTPATQAQGRCGRRWESVISPARNAQHGGPSERVDRSSLVERIERECFDGRGLLLAVKLRFAVMWPHRYRSSATQSLAISLARDELRGGRMEDVWRRESGNAGMLIEKFYFFVRIFC